MSFGSQNFKKTTKSYILFKKKSKTSLFNQFIVIKMKVFFSRLKIGEYFLLGSKRWAIGLFIGFLRFFLKLIRKSPFREFDWKRPPQRFFYQSRSQFLFDLIIQIDIVHHFRACLLLLSLDFIESHVLPLVGLRKDESFWVLFAVG